MLNSEQKSLTIQLQNTSDLQIGVLLFLKRINHFSTHSHITINSLVREKPIDISVTLITIPALFLTLQISWAPANYRNIIGRNMLRAFGDPVATRCDMLGIENRTIAHTRVQHFCTNLAKIPQHHVTSTNVAWKIWPFSNLSQQHPT